MDETEIRRRAGEAADALLGTCASLHEEFEEIQDNRVFGEELDSRVLQCETCGWWHEPCEIHKGVCLDCRDDNKEEED